MMQDTVIAALLESSEAQPDKPFLRWLNPARTGDGLESFSFAQLDLLFRRAIGFLRERGVLRGDRLLFMADNSPQLIALHVAAQTLGVEVAIVASALDSAQVRDIARRVSPRGIFVGNVAQWACVALALEDSPNAFCVQAGSEIRDPRAIPWTAIEESDPISKAEHRAQVDAVASTWPFVLIFTSGTTGRQKGVPITQGNIAASLRGLFEVADFEQDDTWLLFLPFAHIVAHCELYGAATKGASVLLLSRQDDIPSSFAFAPTRLVSVPVMYERVWQGLRGEIEAARWPMSRILRAGWTRPRA